MAGGSDVSALCRDVLRVISAQEGSNYEEDLGPVIDTDG